MADITKIAGYLPYNPSPGIYSRLERAIEQMLSDQVLDRLNEQSPSPQLR